MSGGYFDLQAEAEKAMEERNFHRRRMISGIRGALRSEFSPRALMFLALGISAIPGAFGAYLTWSLGLHAPGIAPAGGILLAWPCFILVSRRIAHQIFATGELFSSFQANVSFDRLQRETELYEIFGMSKEQFENGFSSSVRAGLQNAPPGTGLIATLVIGLLTLGFWFIWQIVRYGPTMLAELILDDCMAERRPSIFSKVSIECWKENAFAATCAQFVGLALVVLLLCQIQAITPATGWNLR